jgi:hypothetical protein
MGLSEMSEFFFVFSGVKFYIEKSAIPVSDSCQKWSYLHIAYYV